MSLRYELLRTFKYRDSETLVVTNVKSIPYRSIPERLHIWFLVHYHWNGQYNLEVRTDFNDEQATLGALIKHHHATFIDTMNNHFSEDSERKYRRKEAIHLFALQPEAPLTTRQKRRQAELDAWSKKLREQSRRASQDSDGNRKKLKHFLSNKPSRY